MPCVSPARGTSFKPWKAGESRWNASDLVAVRHLSDCLADASRELDQAADVVAEAQERLLTVAVEKMLAG